MINQKQNYLNNSIEKEDHERLCPEPMTLPSEMI